MIEWKPFSPKSIDFLQHSDARLNILDGSVRSAKTISCTVRWLDYIVSGPPGALAMLGKTMATLQRNVLNDLFDMVGPKNYHWVNRQQGELMVFGRRIYCFGANNEDAESKIRGATLAGALCDEVSLYPQSVFNQLMARLSVKGAQCFCNTNPDSPYHWFYTEYIKNDQIKNKKCWHFTMDDNLSLDEEYKTSLKQMYTGVWYDRMIKGLWVAAEGRVYDMFEPAKHVIDTAKWLVDNDVHPFQCRWTVACDYGTSSVMSWGLYCKVSSSNPDADGVVLKVREFYYDAVKEGQQHTDSEFAREFVRWLAGKEVEVVYCDPSAVSWRLELMRRGYNVQPANNDVINGIRYVSSQLSKDKYFIDRSCKSTELEYSSYVWDSKAQSQGIDKPLKVHDHAVDTDRYNLYTDSQGALSGVYSVGGRR